MKSSQKVEQIKKNPAVELSIWSGKMTDPYLRIKCKAEVHEYLDIKKNFWDSRFEPTYKNQIILIM